MREKITVTDGLENYCWQDNSMIVARLNQVRIDLTNSVDAH